ncbi:MAG: HU family DNA-binding protein [Bdellovibrionales bacterium]|nr:HU family DNA-binding protein [Bdellovibrionales bacterium]
MNKAQLIERLSRQVRLSKSKSEKILNVTLEIIQNSVSNGEDVKLVGFGTFDRSFRKPRKGRNPKTGIEVPIPATSVPRFRPGKEFKDLVAE